MSEVLELFLELAALPTPPGRERAAADLVARYLRDLALEVEEDDAGAVVDGDTGNLLARLAPTADEGVPLFLCAHLDTVPPEGPIEPVLADGIVRNASFESGRAPWYLDAGAYRSSRLVHGGGLAIALNADGGFADQAVKLTPGASYELSVWGALGGSWDVGYAGVVFRDANGTRLTPLEPPMIGLVGSPTRTLGWV